MLDDVIEDLLYEPEGPAVDFKQQAYPFADAEVEQKAELLKDILAFANSWRRAEAYILMGVRAVQGGRHEVLGITQDPFDDAHLQQFVKGLTNRTVEVSYSSHLYEGKKIGVIRIPKQQRPVYATRDYGKVRKGLVYYRLGSSTAVATPEDIARMGQTDHAERTPVPSLELQFADRKHKTALGTSLQVSSVIYKYDAEAIPDLSGARGSIFGHADPLTNRNYWRQLAKYMRFQQQFRASGFMLKNLSSVTAEGVMVVIEGHGDYSIVFQGADDEPSFPSKMISFGPINLSRHHSNVRFEQRHNGWTLSLDFGKVQPKQTTWFPHRLYVGAVKEGDHDCNLEAVVYADNLPEPIHIPLSIASKAEKRPLLMEDLENYSEAMEAEEEE